jgi:hypothetical protein
VTTGDSTGNLFTATEQRSVSGIVYYDTDNSGTVSAGDIPLVGIPVSVVCGANTFTTTSGANGVWSTSQTVPWDSDCTITTGSTANYEPVSGPISISDVCSGVNLLVKLKSTLSCPCASCSMRSLGFYSRWCGTSDPKNNPSILASAFALDDNYGFGAARVGACCPTSCGCTTGGLCCTCAGLSAILGAGGGIYALQKQTLTTEINLQRGGTLCDLTGVNSAVLDAILSLAHLMLDSCLNANFQPVSCGYSSTQISNLAAILQAINNVPG